MLHIWFQPFPWLKNNWRPLALTFGNTQFKSSSNFFFFFFDIPESFLPPQSFKCQHKQEKQNPLKGQLKFSLEQLEINRFAVPTVENAHFNAGECCMFNIWKQNDEKAVTPNHFLLLSCFFDFQDNKTPGIFL